MASLRVVALAAVALSRSVVSIDVDFVDAAGQASDDFGPSPIMLSETPFLSFGHLVDDTAEPSSSSHVVSVVATRPAAAATILPKAAVENVSTAAMVLPAAANSTQPRQTMRPAAPPRVVPRNTAPDPSLQKLGKGIDMLRLVQAISSRREWAVVCNSFVSKIHAEEGSVTEEYALGFSETPNGGRVLTFDSKDQASLGRCGAQLKLIAVEAGILGGMTPHNAGSVSLLQSDLAQSATSMLGNAEELEAIIDSPWARDACQDIAHAYLTAHLAHPEMNTQGFCAMYAKDLAGLQDESPSAAVLTKHAEAQKLRRHSNSKLKMKTQQAAAAKAARSLELKAKEEAAKLEAAKKAAAAKAESDAKAAAAMIVKAENDSTGFLHDAASASVANAAAVDWELDHPDGQGIQQQAPQKVEPSVVPVKAKLVPSKRKAALAVQKVTPAVVQRPLREKPQRESPKVIAKSPAQPASGTDDDGAAFWGEMFQS